MNFDKIELNHLLVLVQDRIDKHRNRRYSMDADNYIMSSLRYANLEEKILKMLEE